MIIKFEKIFDDQIFASNEVVLFEINNINQETIKTFLPNLLNGFEYTLLSKYSSERSKNRMSKNIEITPLFKIIYFVDIDITSSLDLIETTSLRNAEIINSYSELITKFSNFRLISGEISNNDIIKHYYINAVLNSSDIPKCKDLFQLEESYNLANYCKMIVNYILYHNDVDTKTLLETLAPYIKGAQFFNHHNYDALAKRKARKRKEISKERIAKLIDEIISQKDKVQQFIENNGI